MNITINITLNNSELPVAEVSVGDIKYTKELVTVEDVDRVEQIMQQRSNCCKAPVAIFNERIHCTRCSAVCNEAPKEKGHVCCGSRAYRHKVNCPTRTRKIVHLECDDCQTKYEELSGKKHVCPACEGENVFAVN